MHEVRPELIGRAQTVSHAEDEGEELEEREHQGDQHVIPGVCYLEGQLQLGDGETQEENCRQSHPRGVVRQQVSQDLARYKN